MTIGNTHNQTPKLLGVFSFFKGFLAIFFSCVLALTFMPSVPVFATTPLQKLSSYTTYYNPQETGRSKNIALACKRINNVTLQAYGDFSFNQCVGKRSKEFGFEEAKIILDGEFVLGRMSARFRCSQH